MYLLSTAFFHNYWKDNFYVDNFMEFAQVHVKLQETI